MSLSKTRSRMLNVKAMAWPSPSVVPPRMGRHSTSPTPHCFSMAAWRRSTCWCSGETTSCSTRLMPTTPISTAMASSTLDTGAMILNAAGKYKIDYYGYFDSYKCYTYGTYFVPVSTTLDKKCPGEWSGDYLNYLTTARIDALRKVLYGGTRSTRLRLPRSDHSRTRLIPQDAHSWGKEYAGTFDDYDIHDYTPYNVPTAGRYPLFANTTPMTTASWTTNTDAPLLRVLPQNQPYRIWEWVSMESPVAGSKAFMGYTGPGDGHRDITDFNVRVEVCKAGFEDELQAVSQWELQTHRIAAGLRRERRDAVRLAHRQLRQEQERRRAS